ncbi:MAG: class I SAM-dependent methyltransferase [Rhodospirillales bacterium]
MKACASCGFVYLENAPVYEELAVVHAWEKSAVAEGEARKRESPVLQAVSKGTRFRLHWFKRRRVADLARAYLPPGRVVDVGCGDGAQIAALPQGYVPCGIEISTAIAARAQAALEPRGGFAVNAPAIEGLKRLPAGGFTGVVMRSFLEHDSDPRDTLAGVARALAPGGAAIIKVPNYASVNRIVMGRRWCGFRWPDHVNYFTPASLTRMIEGTGLRIARFGFLDRLPTSDNMWMVAQKPA